MNILIIDDEDGIRDIMNDILTDEGHTVLQAADGEAGLNLLKTHQVELVFLDVWMPKLDGIQVLKAIRAEFSNVSVVMISGHAMIDHAVEATKLGATDFLEKPIGLSKLLEVVSSVEKSRKKNKIFFSDPECHDQMLGECAQMQEIRQKIAKASAADSRVLILGENGCGKELIARELHNKSDRRDKTFVAVNCAAIPDNLIESELFGHVKGAFSGATNDHDGKFKLADNGTLFLDEIADMSLSAQAKVLRVLQENELSPIGSTKVIKVDVRVIAATNKDLITEMEAGRFRKDLFYRLNVVTINVPPLRERSNDIPILIDYFANKLVASNDKIKNKPITPDAMSYLQKYSWPGNIRQLRNMVERLLILSQTDFITISDVQNLLDEDLPTDHIVNEDYISQFNDKSLDSAKEQFLHDLIIERLKAFDFDISKTAVSLGMYASNMYPKLKKLGIDVDKLKTEK